MKRSISIIILVVFSCMAIVGCGKQDIGDRNTEDISISTTQIDADIDNDNDNDEADIGDNSAGSAFGNFVADTPNLGDFEVYDDVSDVSINFSIEDFKLENIENFDEIDIVRIDDFTEDELKLIATTKADLLRKLKLAFSNAGINVEINDVTGEVSLDSSILFGGDSAELSPEGKEFLQKFISTYTNVVFSDEFDGFISKIIVEGHTAPLSGSTYESGLPLSKERANNVKSYCLSSESGVSSDSITELTDILEAVGMSNSKPVKDSSGKVDIEASRRVSFRFLINLDN